MISDEEADEDADRTDIVDNSQHEHYQMDHLSIIVESRNNTAI